MSINMLTAQFQLESETMAIFYPNNGFILPISIKRPYFDIVM